MNLMAKFNIDALIPLLIGAFWIISQIVAAVAKKKAPPSRRPETGDGKAAGEDPFADLMRKLSGVQEFKIPEPPKPKVKAASPWQPDDIESLPDMKPIRQTAPVPEPVEVPAVVSIQAMGSFKSAMPSMKLPAMTLSFRGLENRDSGVPRVGRIIDPSDKTTIRRAILGHIILGKPKAMEGWNTGTVE
jgi:hypothetical protein